MECEKNCFSVNRDDLSYVFIDRSAPGCSWLRRSFLKHALTLCPSCCVGYSLVLKRSIVFFIVGSLDVISTFLHKPQEILGLSLLQLSNGKLNKQKKQKEVVWIIYKCSYFP